MRKKILVAEEVDTIRSVAETVLRQNGFEVISVASADRAREVLQFARPDAIVMGANVHTRDSRPLYEKVQADPRTASVPILIIAGEDNHPVPFPREAVVARPLEPVELLQKVQVLVGDRQPEPSVTMYPLSADSVSDDFLDAALGTDNIHVTDSEVLDRTNLARRAAHAEPEKEEMSDSSRVESLQIPSDTEIRQPKPKAKPQPSAATGRLEIMSDQYGLSNPDALKPQVQHQNHDYDWFVSSMREENDPNKKPAAPPVTEADVTFTIEDPLDSAINLALTGQPSSAPTGEKGGSKSTVGVEKFIDEFKREMERLRSVESDDELQRGADAHTAKGEHLRWEESVEKFDSGQAALFTRQLAADLAEKLAQKIIAKIDTEKLLQLIAHEIAARANKH